MTNNPFYVATSATKKVSSKRPKGGSQKRSAMPVSPDAQGSANHHKNVAHWIWALCVVAVVLAFL